MIEYINKWGKNRHISYAEDFPVTEVDITLSRRGSKALLFVSADCECGLRTSYQSPASGGRGKSNFTLRKSDKYKGQGEQQWREVTWTVRTLHVMSRE